MRTFSFDENLPSLPVPDLEKTVKKYLESIVPFLNELEFQRTAKIVDDFRTGIGKNLQFHLVERSRNERNWVWIKFTLIAKPKKQ